ncbi:MAG: FecR domain-containing protein [Bacteriovoracaceae bacterium]|nr:FecR domain-containing protein [Bacteriovoracaceae bacterium]
MFRIIVSVFIIFSISTAQAKNNPSGSVIKLVGKALVLSKGEKKPTTLKKGASVKSGDIIKTGKKSFVRIQMSDKTTLSLGPKSKLVIKHYEYKSNVIRKTIYNLQYGKLRSLINKKANPEDQIKINSKVVSLAIRGTEILSNSYLVQKKATTDTMLLSGKANATVNGSSKAIKSFDVKAGQVFNSNKFANTEGLKALEKVSPDTLEALKNDPNKFLPKLQLPSGEFVKFESLLRSGLGLPSLPVAGIGAGVGAVAGALTGAAAGMLAGGSDKEEKMKEVAVKPVKKPKKKVDMLKHSNIIEQASPIDLAKLPEDIRDAYLKRKHMKKENECYYWFYKKIPGYGNTERFRRERDCDEYDNDL